MNWNSFRWRSLKTRLMVLTLAVFLLGIWVLALYISRTLRDDMQRLLGEQQFSTAAIVAAEIEQEIGDRLRALETVGGQIVPAMLGDTARLQTFLEQRFVVRGMFNGGITVAGRDGKVIAEIPRSAGRIGVNYSDRDFMRSALQEGKSTVGRPVKGRLNLAPVIGLAAPVRDAQGNVIGALTGVVNLAEPNFLDKITGGNYGATGSYLLVAPQHRLIVTSSDKTRIMNELPAPGDSPTLDRFIQGYEGSAIFVNPVGVEVLASAKGIPAAGWYLGVQLPVDDAFAPIAAMQQRILLATLLLTLLIAWLSWWLLGRQLAPLMATVKTLADVAATGQVPQSLPVVRPDEIGNLIGGFNRMMEILTQREAALRESDASHKATLEAVPDLLLELALDGSYLAYHSTGRNLRVAPWETLRGKSVRDVLPTEAAAVMMAALEEANETGRSQGKQFTLLLPQGRRWLELSVVRKAAAPAMQPSFIVLSRDITERKSNEAVLAQYAAIVENSQDAIISRGVGNLEVITWNAAAARMFGYAAHEVIGKGINFMVPEDEKTQVERNRALLAAGVAVPAYDTVRVSRDGRRIDVSITQSAILAADGAMIGVSLIVRDISERKGAEDALRQSEARHRSILRTTLDGFWLVDARSGRILEVNDSYCRMSGYSAAELLAMRVVDLDPMHSDTDISARMQKIREQGEHRFETRQRRKNGTVFAVEVSVKYSPEEGGRVVSFIRDITARNVMEAQLREAQKMQAIGTLAGGIAHDFNNIIATILGNAELARQDASSNPVALESLAEIRKAGARARELVRQILAFSRREPTERKRILLGEVVEESARLLRATLPSRVALETCCEAEVPAVMADVTQMEQVLINLATNGMQALRGEPGRIEIRLDSIVIDTALSQEHPALRVMHGQHPGRAVRLTVSDDGPGMDAETLSRVFEPFFTTKSVDEGTGLGLSVVHGIVQAHEGAVVAASEPGLGAVFTVYLPLAGEEDSPANPLTPGQDTSAAVASETAEEGARAAGSRHILYLDDDESLVFLVKRLLERKGLRVSAFIDQGEALAALRADPGAFDLVLTDYNMPGMSGLDVAREVRAIRAGLPVAIASGFIDEALHAAASGAGVRELIFKADAVDEFCSVVQRLAVFSVETPPSQQR